jgi:hypothetical protein
VVTVRLWNGVSRKWTSPVHGTSYLPGRQRLESCQEFSLTGNGEVADLPPLKRANNDVS